MGFSQGMKKILGVGLALGMAASVSAAKTPVKVGSVFPMTGPIATYGQESVNGMELALEKIKKDSSFKYAITLIKEDNKGEPIESGNAVKKLIDVDGVNIVVGSVASSNTLAGAPIAQKAGVPLLTPASTNEKVTEVGNFISRTCFTDAFQGVVMAKFAKENLGKKKAAVVIDKSSDYSKGLAEVFTREFKKMGGEVIDDDFAYNQKETDFKSLVRRLKRSKPDVVFMPGYYTEVGLMLRQARDLKFDVPFLGGDGWDSPKLAELAGAEGIKGNYISSHFSADDTDPRVQEFVKAYKKRYQQTPGAMAALGYDGLLVVADALKRAKSASHNDLRDAINQTKGFVGVTGSITIDQNRNAQKSAVVLETTMNGNVFKEKVSP